VKRLCLCLAAAMATTLAAPSALAQRTIVGGDDDEDDDGAPRQAPPPPEKKDEKKDDKKDEKGAKKDDKKDAKKDDKKADDKAKADGKGKKGDKAKDDKKGPVDVLADTDEDKARQKAEDEARKKAEASASAEDKKKAEAQRKLQEEKAAAEEKRRQASRADRLASAKRERAFRRTDGDEFVVIAEVAPGEVKKGKLVEMKLEIFKPLDVPDPKFGSRMPWRNLNLTATVVEPTGKKDAKTVYAIHSMGAPGRYGVHFTPGRDGVIQVQITGEAGDRSVNVTIPLHVGVWPPPDFEEEDKRLFQ